MALHELAVEAAGERQVGTQETLPRGQSDRGRAIVSRHWARVPVVTPPPRGRVMFRLATSFPAAGGGRRAARRCSRRPRRAHLLAGVAVVSTPAAPRRRAIASPAPAPHRRQDVPERPPLVGEPVLVAGRVFLVGDPAQHPLVDSRSRRCASTARGMPSATWKSSKRRRPRTPRGSRAASTSRRSGRWRARSGTATSSKRVRRIATAPRHLPRPARAHACARRAGEPVAVLGGGELVGRHAVRGVAALARDSRPRPLGSDTCPGWSASVSSTRPPRCRAVVPAPGRRRRCRGAAASAGLMRSAPCASFFRHAGSRKIVLAVDERRSPAESTNGNAGSARAPARRGGRSAPSSSSGIARFIGPSAVACAATSPRTSSTVNITPDGLGEDRVEQRSPSSSPSPSKPARRTESGYVSAQRWAAPHRSAAAAAPSGRVGPSVS